MAEHPLYRLHVGPRIDAHGPRVTHVWGPIGVNASHGRGLGIHAGEEVRDPWVRVPLKAAAVSRRVS
jgi:hypothetical protein